MLCSSLFDLGTELALKGVVEIPLFKLPSSAQIFKQLAIYLAECLEPVHIETLRHGRRVVWKLDNEDLVLGAELAKFRRPSMSTGSILQDDERPCWVKLTPHWNDPRNDHELKQILVVRSRLSCKNASGIICKVIVFHTRQERHLPNCWLCPMCRRAPVRLHL